MFAAKSSFESQLVEQFTYHNSNKIFKHINNIIKTDNFPVEMHLYEKTATFNLDKANLFNEFFESVYTKECLPPNFDSIPPSNNENALNTTIITDSEVYTALPRLDPTKACGIDGIGPKLLHSSALTLYQVIHHYLLSVFGIAIFLPIGNFIVLFQYTSLMTKV